jgi:hypothetical protein
MLLQPEHVSCYCRCQSGSTRKFSSLSHLFVLSSQNVWIARSSPLLLDQDHIHPGLR